MYYDEMGGLLYDDEIFSRLVLDDGREVEYLVSNYGRVWSEKSNKFLSMNIDKRSGRKRFSICVEGRQFTLYLARAIALAFLGPGPGLDADHIDEDYTNDTLDNIQWLTPKENKQKTHKEGKIKDYKFGNEPGDKNPNHIYTEELIHEVCQMMENGCNAKIISQKTGVPIPIIKNIRSGYNWKCVSIYYDIENMGSTPVSNLPKNVIEFIKESLIKGITNKDIEEMVEKQFGFYPTYDSITNHKRRLKEKGLIK